MIDQLILKFKGYFDFLEKHPKEVFISAMVILSVSFIGMIIQGVFFPVKKEDSFQLPFRYSKSEKKKAELIAKENEEAKIMKQLEAYKLKRSSNALTKEDSIRVDYLLNQIQNLKNGH